MTVESFLELAGIPLLLFVILMYYGMRLWIMKDVAAIRGKNSAPLKDPEGYAKAAGQLMVFFAVATLVMILLLLWNVYVAVAEIIICTIILVVLWGRIHKRYAE
jgi:4-hydroxybenzoate polyprenyltransferase